MRSPKRSTVRAAVAALVTAIGVGGVSLATSAHADENCLATGQGNFTYEITGTLNGAPVSGSTVLHLRAGTSAGHQAATTDNGWSGSADDIPAWYLFVDLHQGSNIVYVEGDRPNVVGQKTENSWNSYNATAWTGSGTAWLTRIDDAC